MTAMASGFALIGRSFPSETFEGLYQTSLVSRRAQPGGAMASRRPLQAQNAWLSARRLPVMPSAGR